MADSIPVSEETKSMLAVLIEDEENWDEFLIGLTRRERDVPELSGPTDGAASWSTWTIETRT